MCVCRIFCLPELSEVRSLEGFVGVQHRLLHLEELQAARDIERYDLFNVGTDFGERKSLLEVRNRHMGGFSNSLCVCAALLHPSLIVQVTLTLNTKDAMRGVSQGGLQFTTFLHATQSSTVCPRSLLLSHAGADHPYHRAGGVGEQATPRIWRPGEHAGPPPCSSL